MESIANLPKRTISKIAKRMELGCSNCGWNLATCDFHHIVHQAKGGGHEHSNLCYLCPNCHRLAHTGLLTEFLSFDKMVGDSWKEHYFPHRAGIKVKLEVERRVRRVARNEQTQLRIEKLKSTEIDYSKFGWVQQASNAIGITPQKTRKWIEKNCPELLDDSFSR